MKSRIIVYFIAIFFANTTFATYVISPTLLTTLAEAQNQCPTTCEYLGHWTGHWWTTADPVSVCECLRDIAAFTCYEDNYPAGAVWSTIDPTIICPQVCLSQGSAWTNKWYSIGGNAICTCRHC